MNIGLVSLGSGGTMGHMSLTTKLSDKLSSEKNIEIFIFSEYNYKDFSNVNDKKSKFVQILKQKHMKTVGGCLEYEFKEKLISQIDDSKIDVLIFSTFFDLEILKYARKKNIKTILLSYPLRDSHRNAILVRKYYSYFDKIFTLNDISKINFKFPNEEIVSPLLTEGKNKECPAHKIKNVLITCGGGGRPSSKVFFEKIEEIVPKILRKYDDLTFTIITGNYTGKICINDRRVKILKWSNKFSELLLENDFVISEAGFFTLVDLISLKCPAILIPGERRIDNQELRAVDFEDAGCGFSFFLTEPSLRIENALVYLIENPSKMHEFYENFIKLKNKVFSLVNIGDAILNELSNF